MGAIHEGHLSLVKSAQAENPLTAVSIFVNPTQFGPNEDFDAYPRQLEQDARVLEDAGVDLLFAPDARDIYPDSPVLKFEIGAMADRLCARSRPGHMEGVLQVVSILFHLLGPDRAYFGEKDFQQYVLIDRMVKELHFPLKVVPCPIVREADGLALSSRNVYLSPEERQEARALFQTLCQLRDQWPAFSHIDQALSSGMQLLGAFPRVRLDYLEILEADTLQPITDPKTARQPRAFVAAFLGNTRLIDNLPLT